MSAGYNNETGRFDYLEWLYKGDWYDDEHGNLYICPKVDVVAENEGPDNEVMDKLNAFAREHHRNPGWEEAEAMGLYPVSDMLKRFNTHDGYYHA